MTRIIAQRLLHLVPVLLLVSLAAFLMLELVPGDPAVAILGADAAPEAYVRVRDELGLDDPVLQRYGAWLGDVFRGDLGQSLVPPTQDVRDMIASRLPVTLQLAAMGTALALLLAIPAALLAAYRQATAVDRAANTLAFAAMSVPSFLAALILVYLFVIHDGIGRAMVTIGGVLITLTIAIRTVLAAPDRPPGPARNRLWAGGCAAALATGTTTALLWARWPELPRQGFSRLTDGAGIGANLRHAILPAFTLALAEAAVFMRVLRNDLISTLQEDFILVAKAKGIPAWRVLLGDALRPSSFSIITVAGVALGRLIGGTVIVETIFNLPGMGTMVVTAISSHDLPVVQGGVLVIAIAYVVVNAGIDVTYAYLDPRTHHARR